MNYLRKVYDDIEFNCVHQTGKIPGIMIKKKIGEISFSQEADGKKGSPTKQKPIWGIKTPCSCRASTAHEELSRKTIDIENN